MPKFRNDLFLRAARRQRTERTPVWLMRQAGRFDPRYREIRDSADLPLESLFRHSDLATEISLLPKRLGVDAIIMFQDILTPLAPAGAPFRFRPGPVLENPIRTSANVNALCRFDPCDDLPFVGELLHKLRAELDGDLPLIGFAGAPLTLAFFLIEGGSPGRSAEHARSMMHDQPALLHKLLDRLSDISTDYLAMQIDSGADAVQLFESVADLLTEDEYRRFAHPYHVRILSEITGRVPTILFVKDQPFTHLMVESGADVLSISAKVDLVNAKTKYGNRVAFQGNVDNHLLRDGTSAEIDVAVESCIRAGGHQGHILNLSHGLLPNTPFDNVRRFIAKCKETVFPEGVEAVTTA